MVKHTNARKAREGGHSGHKFEIRCKKNFFPKNGGCVHRNGKNPQKKLFCINFLVFLAHKCIFYLILQKRDPDFT